jgi:hypothetical protein
MRRLITALIATATLAVGIFLATVPTAPAAKAYNTFTLCSVHKGFTGSTGYAYACVTWLQSTNGAGDVVNRPQYCNFHNETNHTVALADAEYGVLGHPPIQTYTTYRDAIPYTISSWDCGTTFTSWGYDNVWLYVNFKLYTATSPIVTFTVYNQV